MENSYDIIIETRIYDEFKGMIWDRFSNIIGDDFDHSKISYVEFHIPIWAWRTLNPHLKDSIGLFYSSSEILGFGMITNDQKNEYSYTNNIVYDSNTVDKIIRSLTGKFILQPVYYFKSRNGIYNGKTHYVIYVSNYEDKTTLKLVA